MEPEGAVALELRLVEPLIRGRLMREQRPSPPVGEDVNRLIARDRRLDVHEQAVLGLPPVDRRVLNRGDRIVPGGAVRCRFTDADAAVEHDGDPHVDADLADGVRQIVKRERGVATGIDHENVATAAQHHLIQAEVLEVAAVRQVHVRAVVGCAAEHFGEKGSETMLRLAAAPLRLGRIAEPRAQSRVEHRQQERQQWRREGAHVRTGGRTGDGHGRAQ